MSKLAFGFVAALAACATTGTPAEAPNAGVVAKPPPAFGAGSRMMVQLTQPLGAAISYVGERFTATLVEPVLGADGQVIVPAGAQLFGHVADVRPPSGVSLPATLVLAFDELQANGTTLPIKARIIGTDPSAPEHGVSWKWMAGGSAAGTQLGAILGHSPGIIAGASGTTLGAGAGTLISLGSTDRQQLPAGTALALQLE